MKSERVQDHEKGGVRQMWEWGGIQTSQCVSNAFVSLHMCTHMCPTDLRLYPYIYIYIHICNAFWKHCCCMQVHRCVVLTNEHHYLLGRAMQEDNACS